MPNFLKLRFRDDGDGTGKLFARAQADGFSGEAGAYFGIQALAEFAESLKAFPLPEEDPRRHIAGGFYEPEKRGTLKQEHLGISVYLVNPHRGYIGMQVRLATEVWLGSRPESQKKVALELLTTYEPLAKFSRDFQQMLLGRLEETAIEGENLQ